MASDIGAFIKIARKELGFTQKSLAEELGVSTGTVQQWELGVRYPRLPMLKKIEDTLQIALLAKSEEFTKRTNERLEAMRAEDEVRGQESTRVVMEKMQADQAAFVTSPIGRSIIDWFYELNELGQIEAEKRICELTEIPKYQRTTPSEPLADAETNTDNPATEKPPEGQNHPADGK